MKIGLIFTLIACCQAAVILTPRNPDDVGAAVTFNNQDGLGRYDFGYSEGHPSGASFRRESGDAFGNKVGSFGLRDADGRLRIVRYVADANGFRADVTSNEPGVASADPASATINKPAVVPAPVVPVAPVVAAPPPPPPPAIYGPQPKPLPPPPPPQYNLVLPEQAPVAYPPPPPPAAYYNYPPPPPPPPARVVAPAPAIPAPVAPVYAPAPVVPAPAPVVKTFGGFAAAPAPPPPPPPAPYYSNLVGKGYVGAIRNYPNVLSPIALAAPQFGYLAPKPTFQSFGYTL